MLGVTDDRLKAGVWRVADQLLKELATIDKKNTYRLYSFRPIKDYFGPRMTNVVLRPSTGFLRARMPIEIGFHPIDVFLGLGQALPPGLSCPSIGCIYDLGFIEYPEAYPDSYKRLKAQTDDLVKRANNIITISQSSKSDIIKHNNISQDLISVIYPGVDSTFTSKGNAFKGIRPYFLFVGSLKRGKNVPMIIRAFAKFLSGTKTSYDLFLVGGNYWEDPQISQLIKKHRLQGSIHVLGFVSDKELSAIYRGATALVIPSLAEGFCLPVVEAMASSVPVIASDIPVFKEIVGDAGILVDPSDDLALVHALREVVKTSVSDNLRANGLKRAKQFRWDIFARGVLKCVNQA